MSSRRILVAAMSVSVLGGPLPAIAQPGATAPTYVVTSTGLTAGQAAALRLALGLPDVEFTGGVFQYADPARFVLVPSVQVPGDPAAQDEDASPVTTEGIDFAAVRALSPPSQARALRLVRRALRGAGISLPRRARRASRTYFDAFDVNGGRWLHKAIATNVSFRFQTPDGLPLSGPGAAAEFSFDSDERPILVSIAFRTLGRGPDVPIRSQAEAVALCGAGAPAGAAITAELVYYAPPLSMPVAAIVPHYLCGGTAPAESGDTVRLKGRYIPATVPGEPLGPPVVAVSASAVGSSVQAEAVVSGGTPPYTFGWSSANTSLASPNEPLVSYDVTSRDPATAVDAVNATVIDANGLTSSGNEPISVTGVGPQPLPGSDPSGRTVGIEYQSWSAGLVGSEWTARGFQQGAAAAVPAVTLKFLAAELMSWEVDFRSDALAGGRDHQWTDNVDLVYYSGHGFPGGFTFTSLRDFQWTTAVHRMRLGDRDLEWLALDTCLALNNDDGLAVSRLRPMFTGLHSVLGFDTVAADTFDLGGIFADYLYGTATNPLSRSYGAHLTLVQAWALAAIITHDPGHVWAAMGPYGDLGVSGVNDRFWGFGAVGPDLRGTAVKGYWRLSGGT